MNILKKILLYIIEPFHKFGAKGYSEKASKYLSRHTWILYIIALVITVIIVTLSYLI